jgi:hypothetical protein
MSDKTDYKKMWRNAKAENVRLHNEGVTLLQQLRHLLGIPGVVELVKKDAEKAKEAVKNLAPSVVKE